MKHWARILTILQGSSLTALLSIANWNKKNEAQQYRNALKKHVTLNAGKIQCQISSISFHFNSFDISMNWNVYLQVKADGIV